MSRTVLVTGASGFIGRPLSERLQQAGCAVIRHSSADGDIAVCQLRGEGVAHVFHLAARMFVPASWSEPRPFYATNVLGTVNVAELCRRHGASLTMVSSSCTASHSFFRLRKLIQSRRSIHTGILS